MNKITTSLIGISAVLVFTAVSQMTTSQVTEPQFHHQIVLQQDELQAAAETANDASRQALNDRFDDYQIKTLDISTNGTDALHTAIWAVARDLPNGDRELTMGKIYTDMTRQQDGSWKPVASTWTEGPFSKHVNTLVAHTQEMDNEINRNAQTALNQTRQMIVAELIENVKALYQDATLSLAYYDAVLLTVEK